MNTTMYVLVILAVILSFLTMGVYYLWISIIFFFPRLQRDEDVPYTPDIPMHFFIVVPCLNEESVICDGIRALLDLHMPRTRVIVVDDDSEDHTVDNIFEEFGDLVTTVQNDGVFNHNCRRKPLILLQKRKPNAQQGKGKSLNAAYDLISAIIRREGLDPAFCIMSVMDADIFLTRHTTARSAVGSSAIACSGTSSPRTASPPSSPSTRTAMAPTSSSS